MWAINAIMTTRVYLNLVWLVKKPIYGSECGTERINSQMVASPRNVGRDVIKLHRDSMTELSTIPYRSYSLGV